MPAPLLPDSSTLYTGLSAVPVPPNLCGQRSDGHRRQVPQTAAERASEPLANLPLDPPSDYRPGTAATRCPAVPGLPDLA